MKVILSLILAALFFSQISCGGDTCNACYQDTCDCNKCSSTGYACIYEENVYYYNGLDYASFKAASTQPSGTTAVIKGVTYSPNAPSIQATTKGVCQEVTATPGKPSTPPSTPSSPSSTPSYTPSPTPTYPSPPVYTASPTPTYSPPSSTPPVSTPPVSTPPVSTPPVSTPPVSTPPVSTPPVKTPPASTPPVSTPPVSTPPVSTPPVKTPPVSTPPVSTPPVSTSQTTSSSPGSTSTSTNTLSGQNTISDTHISGPFTQTSSISSSNNSPDTKSTASVPGSYPCLQGKDTNCEICHQNGCDKCKDTFFKINYDTPCQSYDSIPNCKFAADHQGCQQCDDGYKILNGIPNVVAASCIKL